MREGESAETDRIGWWRDAKFGLFIHWGPASVIGKEIGWSRIGHPRDHPGHESVPAEEYDRLYERFNPTRFDADAWMRVARDAGMKYVVFVAKHHDGFSLWPTKLRSDYSIAAAPYRKDICRQIADAARHHGLKLGWYYSTRDWTHPDYLVGDNRAYDAFYEGQVRELLTDYGPIDVMWFDHVAGNWRDYSFERLFRMIEDLQPGILINDRAAKFIRPTEDAPSPALAALTRGDFDTPEQQIGKYQTDRAWESCVTITRCDDGGGWSYRPDGETRGFEECIRMLSSCATGDGNLLLNVGPMPTGEFADDQIAVLRRMGEWLGRYGECVYGTRGGPFPNGDWGGSTRKGDAIYLHLFPASGGRVELPPLPANLLKATALTGGSVVAESDSEGIRVSVSGIDPDSPLSVVALRWDRPVETLAPVGG